jgi:hypothetical protein
MASGKALAWDAGAVLIALIALTRVWAVPTTARGWGVQLEGAAVSWAYRVMERRQRRQPARVARADG